MVNKKIALVGNPNCGKTTMFNSLTGKADYVGNWSGVTVSAKESSIKGDKEITLVDLPGIYSLSPYTIEEVVTRDYLTNEHIDVIINIVDASNIERNLYLTTQLLDIGIPIIIALNMMDIVTKNGDLIDVDTLSNLFSCEVVETSASKDEGLTELINRAKYLSDKHRSVKVFNNDISTGLDEIKELIGNNAAHSTDYYAVKIFERDVKIQSFLNLPTDDLAAIETIISNCEKIYDDDSLSIITNERYAFVEKVLDKAYVRKQNELSTSHKIDRILTNKYLALPIFVCIMWAVYYISVSSIGAMATDWTTEVLFGKIITNILSNGLTAIGADMWLHSLIIDGIVGGVGAVLGFVPQLFILFFFLSILEESGYMARAAFIMDKIFRGFGLSGRSFIPLLISSGCGVPGIMASRTIENEKERRITIIVTTFIPCGAKLPIIALIAGAFFKGSSLIAPSVYFLGIAMVAVSGLILKKTKLFKGKDSPFVMELPKYHLPTLNSIGKSIWERVKSFIIKAGTVIFVACCAIWFLNNFDFSLKMVASQSSMLASIGGVIAPIFAPLGFGNWQATVATITGLVAKENVVGSLGVLLPNVAGKTADITSIFTFVSAYSFMAFNMLCAPCVAAIGAIFKEMGSLRWTIIAVAYQTILAYVVAFVIYQFGSILFLGVGISAATFIAIACVFLIGYMIFKK